jgi:outer membrane protein OmpA-like peptidoglycan-associated protein
VLRREDRVVLDATVDVIRANPDLKHIVIEGHADAVEKNASELSLQRAKAAVDYLLKKGVDPMVLDPQGEGSAKPLDSNATAQGRQRNRRVEFRIVDP